jgi:hypothetical protein
MMNKHCSQLENVTKELELQTKKTSQYMEMKKYIEEII